MTIRVFVGCSANNEDLEAQAMLEFTLRKYVSEPLDITWMKLSKNPESSWYSDPRNGKGWNTVGWATPFSAFRWGIPHVCGYQGKAIYMDVDMIARDDIAKLWNQSHPAGKSILAKDETHTCVMLFDCAAIRPTLPSFDQLRGVEGLYRKVRHNLSSVTARFQNNWNCLDGETYQTLDDPDIKVIHFTKVETQPHLKWALPRLAKLGKTHWNAHTLRSNKSQPHKRPDVQPLVDRLWQEAQEAGYTAERYFSEEQFGSYNQVRGGARAA